MPRRFVIALIKHETNTFSPLPTPLTAFGHGNGPAFGAAARSRFAGTNTPMGAYLDLAVREGAEIVTPVAAEPGRRTIPRARPSRRWCARSRKRSAPAAMPPCSICTVRW
jgi:microcystin degradation protein MlrC